MKVSGFFGILCAISLTACSGTLQGNILKSNVNEPVRIGFLGPITGDASGFGADSLHGMQLAVEEINETGGIHGHPVSVIVADSRCDGMEATRAARQLVQVDGVLGIIGGHCSAETLAAAPIVEKAGIPMITPLSSSPEITHAGDFIFRFYPSDAQKGKALVRLFEEEHLRKIAMVSENTEFCLGVRSVVKEALGNPENIVLDEIVPLGTSEYGLILGKLLKMDFDIFLANGQSPTTVAAMVTALRAHALAQPIVSTDAADSATLGRSVPETMEGLRVLSIPSLDVENPTVAAFAARFLERYRNPEVGFYFAALSYESTKLLLETMREAGTEGAAIRDALYAHPGYESMLGTISFDDHGDVRGIPYALKEFQNGVLVEVTRIPLE